MVNVIMDDEPDVRTLVPDHPGSVICPHCAQDCSIAEDRALGRRGQRGRTAGTRAGLASALVVVIRSWGFIHEVSYV